jgi:hypothetical protein
MKLSDEDKDRFEQELEETDTTAILLGIYTELQAIHSLLEGVDGTQEQETNSLTCAMCGETYPSETQLRDHVKLTHKAPNDMPLEDIAET